MNTDWRDIRWVELKLISSEEAISKEDFDAAILDLEGAALKLHEIFQNDRSKQFRREMNDIRVMDYLTDEKEYSKEELYQKLEEANDLMHEAKTNLPVYDEVAPELSVVIDMNEANSKIDSKQDKLNQLKNIFKEFYAFEGREIDETDVKAIENSISEYESKLESMRSLYSYLKESNLYYRIPEKTGYRLDSHFENYGLLVKNAIPEINTDVSKVSKLENEYQLELKVGDKTYSFNKSCSKRIDPIDSVKFLNQVLKEEDSSKRVYLKYEGANCSIFLLNQDQAKFLGPVLGIDESNVQE